LEPRRGRRGVGTESRVGHLALLCYLVQQEPSVPPETTRVRVSMGPFKSGDSFGIRPASHPGEVETDDVAERIRSLLHGEPDLGAIDALSVARRLGLSSRTLSRKLEEQGTNFRTLLDAVRKDIALRELAAGALPLTDIAERLGFGNTPSFHRAFKRWTGTTIGEARRGLQRGDGEGRG
jgi:AraC-like DNA-binding protein